MKETFIFQLCLNVLIAEDLPIVLYMKMCQVENV